jgi:hypothetical protein
MSLHNFIDCIQIRAIDRYYIDNMDVYGCIVKVQGNIVELNKLLATSPSDCFIFLLRFALLNFD